MRQQFEDLASGVLGRLSGDEDALLLFEGERSEFVRFNHGKVRQPGAVTQGQLTLRLIRGQRHAAIAFTIGGNPADDLATADDALAQLRTTLADVPEDPHFLWQTEGGSSETIQTGDPVAAEPIVDTVVRAAAELDFVGILAAGPVFTGLASSRGARHWDARHAWLLDWCLYAYGDKAVKDTLGGAGFDPSVLEARLAADAERLALLQRDPKKLAPGRYRAFLTPAAMSDLVGMMGMDGFSHRAHQTHVSALGRLKREEAALAPGVHLTEDTQNGLGPGFDSFGFVKPQQVPLIREGKLTGTLVNPRSAREYDVPTNGASSWEQPDAVHMAGGDLPTADAVKALGTGLYVSNLWYLNYSDYQQGRVTGMTRFATLWVEDGVPVAPAEPIRFDDTFFHLLGEGLEALTTEVELLPSASTYGQRSTTSQRLPGALVDGMTFTL